MAARKTPAKPRAKTPAKPKAAPKPKAEAEPLDIARAAVTATAGSTAIALLAVDGADVQGRIYLDAADMAAHAAAAFAADVGGEPVVAHVEPPTVRIERFGGPNGGVEDVTLPPGG